MAVNMNAKRANTMPIRGDTKANTVPNSLTLTETVTSEISKIAAMGSYDNTECLVSLKALSHLYWNYSRKRPMIGDIFVSAHFPQLIVKMLKLFNINGLFKDDNVWFLAYYAYNVCWNFSDASPHFAKDLIKHGLVELLGRNISHRPYLDNKSNKNVYYVLKASLSILQNLTRAADKQEDIKAFDKANIKEKLQAHFLGPGNEYLRTLSTNILSAFLREEDSKILEDTGTIPYMVKNLGLALSNSKNRRHQGFSPAELVGCIYRLSVDDKNKIALVNGDVLPHLVKMLQYTDTTEQAMAAKAVWTLSFDGNLRQRIREEAGLIGALEALETSKDEHVKQNTLGALWTLNNAHRETSEVADISKNSVFISYDWSDRAVVKKVDESLKGAGYSTIVDFEKKNGSTMNTSVSAIERAAVVVICASEKYKENLRCRNEAEYTFQTKKPILRLLMQRRYKPDGWLGKLLGHKLYIHVDVKNEYDAAMSTLLKEMAGKGMDRVVHGPDMASNTQIPPTVASVPSTLPVQSSDRDKNARVSEGNTTIDQSSAHKNFTEGISPKTPTLAEEIHSEISKLATMVNYCTNKCIQALRRLEELLSDDTKQKTIVGDLFVSEKFAPLAIKIMKSLESTGLFKNDFVWLPANYIYILCCNASDISFPFAKDLIKHGLVELMGLNISHQPFLEDISDERVYHIVDSSFTLLHNMTRAADKPEELEAFDKANIKETIRKHFLGSEDEYFRTMGTMILTAHISEEENKMLEDNGAIPFMVKTLGPALTNWDRRQDGFSPDELVECVCRMAVNDKNKVRIVNEGALPYLVQMMQHTDIAEQAIAAKTVWNLSFDANLRQQIRDEPGLIQALKALKDSEDKKVKKFCRGALWTLNDAHREVSEDADTAKNHIFISYNMSNQANVKEINEALKEAGFRTWVDFEQMGGSTLEAMATAIEKAAVVVICASEKYKESPNCRAEAEYTFQIKKPILPLMMQRRYKPDGWLGMLLGAKFYINFDGKYEFEEAFAMLLKELDGRGKDKVPVVSELGPDQVGLIKRSTKHATDSIAQWSTAKVAEFFQKDTLSGVRRHFEDYDGKMLYCLKKMRREAPEFFYRQLRESLSLSLRDILKFTSELDSIDREV